MCLGVPGKVLSIETEAEGLPMGRVDFSGVETQVCLAYTPEVKVGEYVLVHVGFALSVLDEAAAQELLRDIAEIVRLDQAARDTTSEHPALEEPPPDPKQAIP